MESKTTDLRSVQIIVLAMLGGCLMFAAILTYLNVSGGGAIQFGEQTVYIAISSAMLAVCAAAAVILRRMKHGQLQSQLQGSNEPPAALLAGALPSLTTATIIGGAAGEASTFLSLILFLIAKDWMLLVLAGIGWILIAMQFPTLNRLVSWAASAAGRARHEFQT